MGRSQKTVFSIQNQWRPTGCRLLGSWLLVVREFVNFQDISIPVIFEFSGFLFLRVPILPLPLGERIEVRGFRISYAFEQTFRLLSPITGGFTGD